MNWIVIEKDNYDSFPKEGIEVLVSDGKHYDVAYYIMSGEYKWVKVDVIQDDINDFNSFVITKWAYIKEEPKQKYEYIGDCSGNNGNGCFMDSSGHDCGCFSKVQIEESKEEILTLEELLSCYIDIPVGEMRISLYHIVSNAYNNGVKWKQEQDKKLYNEEEVLELLIKRTDNIFRTSISYTETQEWFEQFKKK